jgi:hypothetical protein
MSFRDAVTGVENARGAVNDAFGDAAGALGAAQDLFSGSLTPSTLGYGTRQSKLSNNRQAVSTRQVIHWAVPEGPVIQMYVNPQSIRYNYKKDLYPQRTRGGYIVQYFGPQLATLTISGTTGTSGIEGINVLYDLYRYEQLAFDPYALYLASEAYRKATENFDAASTISTIIGGATAPTSNMNPPSLADMAFRVEMFYAGEVYRGFFNDFSVTEQADNIGMFNYDLNFTVTQKRGFRQNFFAWHRSAVDGPSNSDPRNGAPYSFSSLLEYPR